MLRLAAARNYRAPYTRPKIFKLLNGKGVRSYSYSYVSFCKSMARQTDSNAGRTQVAQLLASGGSWAQLFRASRTHYNQRDSCRDPLKRDSGRYAITLKGTGPAGTPKKGLRQICHYRVDSIQTRPYTNAKKTFKKCRVAPPRRRHRGFCVPWGCCGRRRGPGRRSDDRQETF